MTLLDALIVFAVCVAGSFLVWVAANLLAAWKRRRDEDARFRRDLARSGPLTSTGDRTGWHSLDVRKVVTVADLQARIEETAAPSCAGPGWRRHA